MLPSKVSSNPTDMSADEAVDLLVKTAEVTLVNAAMVKVATPAWLSELINPTSLAGRTARNALLGSGVGGLVGALRERNKSDEERNYVGGASRGALLGGLLGGAGTLAVNAWPGFNEKTDAEKAIVEAGERDATYHTNAQQQMDRINGKNNGPITPTADGGDSLVPALGLTANPSQGLILGYGPSFLDSRTYKALLDTPRGTAGGLIVGSGIGGGAGRAFGNFVTGVPNRAYTDVNNVKQPGDISKSTFAPLMAFKGLTGPNAENASSLRTGFTLAGAGAGAVGGAFGGHALSALLHRLKQ